MTAKWYKEARAQHDIELASPYPEQMKLSKDAGQLATLKRASVKSVEPRVAFGLFDPDARDLDLVQLAKRKP